MNSQQTFEWQLGQWAGLPVWLSWVALVLVAFSGVVLSGWLYRDTLQKLAFRQRCIFAALRCGFFLSLLLCLAGPSRVERLFDGGTESRPLAVVVDRSASMTTPDGRGQSRLDAAVRTWKESESAAQQNFHRLRYFSFDFSLRPANTFEDAATPSSSDSAKATVLFDSLGKVLESNPGGYAGVVCLTDGLDTTSSTSDQLVALAMRDRTPLYFVAGQNGQNTPQDLIVRETVAPGQVLRKSEFTTTALIEAHSVHDRDVPLVLTQNDHPLAQTMLHLRAGTNLIPWDVPVHSDEPCLMHLAWRLGDGADQESVAATVHVVKQDQLSVLFYQGTLDWGFRFINAALQRDASFSVAGLFNPDLDLDQVVSSDPAPALTALTALPESAEALQNFQIVVLANAYASQMSPAQQKAITDYVSRGGGLLFLVSDTKMAQTYSGTALEAMLPVVFEPPPEEKPADESLADFQAQMLSIGGSNGDDETEFAAQHVSESGLASLQSFALPEHSTRPKIAELFGTSPNIAADEIPKFVDYAHVSSLKSGAEVLAIHPGDKSDGVPRALLVTQRFGQGQVTALLTDALWRWKLSLPSTSHAPEKFWQELFLALASPGGTMHFSAQPYYASLGQQSTFRIDGAPNATAPTVTLVSPDAATRVLALEEGSHPGEWTFQFSPDQPGKWRIRVGESGGSEIETLLRVSQMAHGNELSGLPPDVDGLRKLAQVTGGSMLNDGTPDRWSGHAAPAEATLISEHSRPLWDTWMVLLLALSFYAVELVWRRRAKLL